MMKPVFFRTPSAFRAWLEANHASAGELWVGFYKKGTGLPSLTWPESVDEALCFGWIDGIRKRLDDVSYVIRFTPRRSRSVWSTVNAARARELIAEGRMQAAGLEAYRARAASTTGIYSYEQRPTDLPEPIVRLLKKDRAAWAFFRAQPPSYRKVAAWWVVSAKKEDTRQKRLAKLAACSARGQRLQEITLQKPSASRYDGRMPPTRRELLETHKQNPPAMGIFQIRHLQSGRVFVVAARNVQGIMNSHRFQLRFGSHPNKRLQTDWNAGGPGAFAFEELDRLAPVDALGTDAIASLAHLEALWLEKLAPYGDRGYNTRK